MPSVFRVAPLGATALVWTGGFLLAVAAFAYRVFSIGPSLYDLGAGITLLLLSIYGYLRSVRSYILDNDSIVVRRAGPGRVSVPLAELARIESAPDLGSFFNISFLSIGGLFGWAGRARIRKPTDVQSLDATVYGTNPTRSVLLTLRSGRLIVLTPADPQAFVESVRKAAPAAPRPAGARPTVRDKRRSGR